MQNAQAATVEVEGVGVRINEGRVGPQRDLVAVVGPAPHHAIERKRVTVDEGGIAGQQVVRVVRHTGGKRGTPGQVGVAVDEQTHLNAHTHVHMHTRANRARSFDASPQG